jgi:hypothetical protein
MTMWSMTGGSTIRPEHAVLRQVVDPLPTPVERIWVGLDRLQDRLTYLQRHAPNVEEAAVGLARETLDVALAAEEPSWPSAIDVLAAQTDLAAHDANLKALYLARNTAEVRLGRAIEACEGELCAALDDKLPRMHTIRTDQTHLVPARTRYGAGRDLRLPTQMAVARYNLKDTRRA